MRRPLSWRDLGACRDYDPEDFFSDDVVVTEMAKVICSRCPVKDECLQWALALPEKFGVWGGLDKDQRKVVSYKRTRVKCPGCKSGMVSQVNRIETCEACGLSWPI